MADIQERIAQKSKEFSALYERYAAEFEREHRGEWVALCPGESPVFGTEEDAVREQARLTFGSQEFALWQIGHIRGWRSQHR